MKISENILQKSRWQSFKNEKSEMAILFVFPCSSSWCTLFFLLMHFSWRKSRNNIAFFQLFSKKLKQAILFRNFLHEKCIDRKNRVHHDEEHGKTKKMAISDFSFSKLCHRDFCKTFSEIFNFFTPLHSQNAEEMDFCMLGPLKLCNLWAWLNCFLGVYGKSLGVQNDWLGQHLKMDATGKFFFNSPHPPFCPVLFTFFQKVKTGNFVSWFSPWKMYWQKKTEYTTMKSTEKWTRWSSPIF